MLSRLTWTLALLYTVGCSGRDSGDLTYCDVEPIIFDKCTRCHTDPPEHFAPFPLETYDEVFKERVKLRAAVKSGFMPYTGLELEPPVEDLTPEERDTLILWVEQGAADCQ